MSVPNVLTEASNLIGSGAQEIVAGANAALAEYVLRVDEIYRPSEHVVRGEFYDRFGLADAAIAEAAAQTGASVVTNEHALFGVLASRGIEAINLFQFKQLS